MKRRGNSFLTFFYCAVGQTYHGEVYATKGAYFHCDLYSINTEYGGAKGFY